MMKFKKFFMGNFAKCFTKVQDNKIRLFSNLHILSQFFNKHDELRNIYLFPVLVLRAGFAF